MFIFVVKTHVEVEGGLSGHDGGARDRAGLGPSTCEQVEEQEEEGDEREGSKQISRCQCP